MILYYIMKNKKKNYRRVRNKELSFNMPEINYEKKESKLNKPNRI